MKTPDEIKKGLLYHGNTLCDDDCPYQPLNGFGCRGMLCDDAFALIQQLEEKYKHAMENAKILSDAVTKLERERDFLIKYLTESNFLSCDICKHEPEDGGALNCERVRKIKGACFEWRGLPEDDDER